MVTVSVPFLENGERTERVGKSANKRRREEGKEGRETRKSVRCIRKGYYIVFTGFKSFTHEIKLPDRCSDCNNHHSPVFYLAIA